MRGLNRLAQNTSARSVPPGLDGSCRDHLGAADDVKASVPPDVTVTARNACPLIISNTWAADPGITRSRASGRPRSLDSQGTKSHRPGEAMLADRDLFEINEAFAVQALIGTCRLPFPINKVKSHGDAVAVGIHSGDGREDLPLSSTPSCIWTSSSARRPCASVTAKAGPWFSSDCLEAESAKAAATASPLIDGHYLPKGLP